jgi:hypothetical protein
MMQRIFATFVGHGRGAGANNADAAVHRYPIADAEPVFG